MSFLPHGLQLLLEALASGARATKRLFRVSLYRQPFIGVGQYYPMASSSGSRLWHFERSGNPDATKPIIANYNLNLSFYHLIMIEDKSKNRLAKNMLY